MKKHTPYQRTNVSKLETWRDDIVEMRSLNWPHDAIAQWLAEECNFSISGEAVRQFCKVRNISKGPPATEVRLHRASTDIQNSRPTQNSEPAPMKKRRKKKFSYDASKPIQINRNVSG
ncbi:MAG: hypothetical protein ACPGN3_11790 [Opitutales bacterium]